MTLICCARIELVFQLRGVGWRHKVSTEPQGEDQAARVENRGLLSTAKGPEHVAHLHTKVSSDR